MNQNLIDRLLQNLMTPNNIHGALPGLIIKAACLRHNQLSEKPDGLTEDEQDELSYLQEWFDQNHFDYLLDSDDGLHMRDMTPTNYDEGIEDAEPEYGDWDQDAIGDDDDQPSYSHSQQCFIDRQDYARERYEAGEISAEQADEIRHGA